ncbi:TIGR02594 family protein [Microbacteriaceae bacterium K1510]|nr:TIGR02594 family protein [Microbacteriaceae bacterium K1510]
MRFKIRPMLLGGVVLLALSGAAAGRPVPQQLPSQPPLPIAKPKEIAQRPAPAFTTAARETAPVERVSLAAATWKSALGMPALVAEAHKYMGTNPTDRTRLWCATFMNLVLAKLGYAGTNSDAARSFAYYGRRVSEPEIGAIAVLTRGKNGGHVGVVSGIDSQGNPIIISGNHNKRVGEAVYARSRVIAYVMPTERRLAPTMVAAARSPAGTSSSDARPDLRLESPITELLAAIEAEQARAETPRAATAQKQQRQVVVPPRLVQQTPEQPQRQAAPRSGSNPFAELASYIERKR